jgi:hypothetical protein
VKIENVFDLIPNVKNTELSAYYPRIHQSIPGELLESDKTPLQHLEELLKTTPESFNLEKYRDVLNPLYSWVNFLIDICRQNPSLEKPCEDYIGRVKVHIKTVEKMKKDADDWTIRNYDQKTLTRKFEKTKNNFFSRLRELRSIFYVFEKKLYGEVKYRT